MGGGPETKIVKEWLNIKVDKDRIIGKIAAKPRYIFFV